MSSSSKKNKLAKMEFIHKYTFRPLNELLKFQTIEEYTEHKDYMEQKIEEECKVILAHVESDQDIITHILSLTEGINKKYPEIYLIPLLKEKLNTLKFALVKSPTQKIEDDTEIEDYVYKEIDETVIELVKVIKEQTNTPYGKLIRSGNGAQHPVLIKDVLNELASELFHKEIPTNTPRVYNCITTFDVDKSFSPGFFPESSYGKIFSVDIYTIHGPIDTFRNFLQETTGDSISNEEILKSLLLNLGKAQNKLLSPEYTCKIIKQRAFDALSSENKLQFIETLTRFKIGSTSNKFLKGLMCVELVKALNESIVNNAFYGKTMETGRGEQCIKLSGRKFRIFSNKIIMNSIRDLLNNPSWPNGLTLSESMSSSRASSNVRLDEFISLFIDGWSSLFANYNGLPPLNHLLGKLVNKLNSDLTLCAEKGGGAFSCFGEGKKVDFDSHLYYVNMDYNSLRSIIDGEFSILKQYLDANNYFNIIFEVEIGEYTIIIKFKETRIRHHTEKSTFPADLTSLDIMYDICVCKNNRQICCFVHTTAAFDLVVTSVNTKDELEYKSDHYVYKSRGHCNILYLSELLRTIKDTFSDDVNFLNRINQGKINKDFERIKRVIQIFRENGLNEEVCGSLEEALHELEPMINPFEIGINLVNTTKSVRNNLVEAIDSFSDHPDVEMINKIISKNIPPHKIKASNYGFSGNEELNTSLRRGVKFLSKSKPILPSKLQSSSQKGKTQKKQITSSKKSDEEIEKMKDALTKALNASNPVASSKISKTSKKRERSGGGKKTKNNKYIIWKRSKTYKKKD